MEDTIFGISRPLILIIAILFFVIMFAVPALIGHEMYSSQV